MVDSQITDKKQFRGMAFIYTMSLHAVCTCPYFMYKLKYIWTCIHFYLWFPWTVSKAYWLAAGQYCLITVITIHYQRTYESHSFMDATPQSPKPFTQCIGLTEKQEVCKCYAPIKLIQRNAVNSSQLCCKTETWNGKKSLTYWTPSCNNFLAFTRYFSSGRTLCRQYTYSS